VQVVERVDWDGQMASIQQVLPIYFKVTLEKKKEKKEITHRLHFMIQSLNMLIKDDEPRWLIMYFKCLCSFQFLGFIELHLPQTERSSDLVPLTSTLMVTVGLWILQCLTTSNAL